MEFIVDSSRTAAKKPFCDLVRNFVFEETLAHSLDGCAILVDQNLLRIVYVNQAFSDITEYDLSSLIRSDINVLSGPKTNFRSLYGTSSLRSGVDYLSGETFCYTANNREIFVRWRVVSMMNNKDKEKYFLFVINEMSLFHKHCN